jgi:hypothetical protein
MCSLSRTRWPFVSKGEHYLSALCAHLAAKGNTVATPFVLVLGLLRSAWGRLRIAVINEPNTTKNDTNWPKF